MNFRIGLCVLTACMVACGSLSYSQAGEASKFKKGDRVEVEHFGKRCKGTVVEINNRFDRIEVRLDDDGTLSKHIPAEAREQFLTSSFRAEELRSLEEPKAPAPQNDVKPRVWKDRTGKFNITATYRGIRDGKIVLETDKGKQIEVPLEKLADEDANYARQLEDDAENPFASSSIGGGFQSPVQAAPKITAANYQGAKVVQPKSFDSWTFKPEASKAIPIRK